MRLFILASFAVLGLAYWQMSGGAGFVPEPWPTETAEAAPARARDAVVATRAASAPVTLAAAPLTLDPEAVAATAVAQAPAEEAAVVPAQAPPPSAPTVAEALAGASAAVAPTAPTAPTAEAALLRVTGERVNVRGGPGTGFGVVGQVAAGELVEAVEEAGGWTRIRAAGAQGWMASRFLAPAG